MMGKGVERIRPKREDASMTGRRRIRAWIVAAGVLGIAGVGFLGFKSLGGRRGKPGASGATAEAPAEKAQGLRGLASSVVRGDGLALATLKARIEADAKAGNAQALKPDEAADWCAVIAGLRSGFPRFSPYGRASALGVVSAILEKFRISPAPVVWRNELLGPSADLLGSALADQSPSVRIAAMAALKDLWNWTPGYELNKSDLEQIGAWKEGFGPGVIRRLSDPEPESRASAVACLGALRVPQIAGPAVALLKDKDPTVRAQVLLSFLDRPLILTEEAILPLLNDPSPVVAPLAKRTLKARGLSDDLIGLAKFIVHPRADLRLSAIGMLKGRTDIDPVVWLSYLSNDVEETIRQKAMEALSANNGPEARTRLTEMALGDPSAAIRKQAKALLGRDETADALPPLPPTSTPGLKLKAN